MMYFPIVILLIVARAQCANILGFFMFPSISHQIVFQPIWRELSLRGHNVTVVTPDPLNDPKLTNLTEISVRYTYQFLQETKLQEMMFKDVNIFQILDRMFQFMDAIVEAELNNTEIKELIGDQNRHFDLILVECFHPVLYAFSGRFKAPIIGVSSLGLLGSAFDVIGNPSHPVLYPDMLLNYHDKELSLWQKMVSVAFSLFSRYHREYYVLPRAQTMAQRYFGDDIPFVGALERNQSMMFLNVNPLIYPPRPNVPAIVEMGQMHIKPVNPLPTDLKVLLDEATEGVVYFSLGSNVKSVHLGETLRNTIIGALGELPYKVLWKWESDHLPGKPSNVITKKWLPQQDLLAHPNIRVFVTQGGLQSTEEAISREVPLVGMPFIGDQPMNVQKMVDLGIALAVDPVTVTKNELKKCIIEVAEHGKYKKRIKEVRDVLFDKPMTGLEKAVWWSEYVIRHKGARHLRSLTADISWFDYLLGDVVIAVVVLLSGMIWGVLFVSSKLAAGSKSYVKLKVQ